ncbi:MAG: T9SS type A sorting domain-containing protein, partial [Candidatus Oleimicrobiaceae bacterium]
GLQVPSACMLHPSYPNPFNPVTTIAFDVATHGAVRLEVYDLLGRRITTLVDAPLAPGRYRVQFDASGLPSGTYFCRLVAQGQVMTRKMTLAR